MVKRSWYKKVIAGLIVICVLVGAWNVIFSGKKASVLVKHGQSAASVANDLKSKKLILSKRLFLMYVKISRSSGKIKAGYYEFSPRNTTVSIVRGLKSGSINNVKVTVPEGSTVKQIAEIFAKKVDIDKDKFIKLATEQKAEGYLMPDTYFINPTFTEKNIIDMMRATFEKRITPDMYERAKEMNISMKDIIIMASIVEKEAVIPQDRPVIAGVFYNRLKARMGLESCATVLYAMGGINKAVLSIQDTKFNSPYNTYKYAGLPPGPICSPGIASINAALYPEQTDNYYFVAKGDGGHLFAETLEQHNKNKIIVRQKQK